MSGSLFPSSTLFPSLSLFPGTSDELPVTTWAAGVDRMAPWCPTNLRAACYTLATDIAADPTPTNETLLAWANQIWDFAATFPEQRWSFANIIATAMVIAAGAPTMAINFTAVLVQAGMAPNQAKAIADYFVAQFASVSSGSGDGQAVAMSVVLG